jgi:hypothetical protein
MKTKTGAVGTIGMRTSNALFGAAMIFWSTVAGCAYLHNGKSDRPIVAVLAGYESERVLPSGHTYRVFTENIDEEDHTNYVAMIFYVVRPHELSGRIFRLHNCLYYHLDDLPRRYYIGKTYAFNYNEKPATKVVMPGGRVGPTSIWHPAPISSKDLIDVGWGEVKMPVCGTVHHWTKAEISDGINDLMQNSKLLESVIRKAEKACDMPGGGDVSFPNLPFIGDWGELNPAIVFDAIQENFLPKNEQEQQRLNHFLTTMDEN